MGGSHNPGCSLATIDTVTRAQIDGGQLTFELDADWNGSTDFTFRAFDGDDWSDGAGTFTVNVDADNDAPTAEAGADQTVDEQTQVTLDAAGSSDPDGDALFQRPKAASFGRGSSLSLWRRECNWRGPSSPRPTLINPQHRAGAGPMGARQARMGSTRQASRQRLRFVEGTERCAR